MFLSKDGVREFEKVSILEKFRCNHVFHFYGACLIQPLVHD